MTFKRRPRNAAHHPEDVWTGMFIPGDNSSFSLELTPSVTLPDLQINARSTCHLRPRFAEPGPQPGSLGLTREPVRKAESWALRRPTACSFRSAEQIPILMTQQKELPLNSPLLGPGPQEFPDSNRAFIPCASFSNSFLMDSPHQPLPSLTHVALGIWNHTMSTSRPI